MLYFYAIPIAIASTTLKFIQFGMEEVEEDIAQW